MHPDLAPLVGSWRLLSVEATFTQTGTQTGTDMGERVATFGPNPSGRMTLTTAGRIMFLITKSNREPPGSEAARATLFNETIAYSGSVRPAGPGRLVTTVEISLFPEEIGTEKLRLFTLDGDRLRITRPAQTSRVTQGRVATSDLVWVREHPMADAA